MTNFIDMLLTHLSRDAEFVPSLKEKSVAGARSSPEFVSMVGYQLEEYLALYESRFTAKDLVEAIRTTAKTIMPRALQEAAWLRTSEGTVTSDTEEALKFWALSCELALGKHNIDLWEAIYEEKPLQLPTPNSQLC